MLAAVLLAFLISAPAPAAASDAPAHQEDPEEAHGEGGHHPNHLALFVGSTEPEEGEGEADDRDFTLGVDYERRLSPLWGVGGMADWVVEGRREYLIGPMAFLHPYRGLKLYAAPCYQRVREGRSDDLVIRLGAGWDFDVGKVSLAPHVIYDLADVQNFLVVGVSVAWGF